MTTLTATISSVGVAVINASYEPLGSTRLKRAMSLVLRGEAVIEEAVPDRLVRHENGFLPWPRVIRLLRYVKVPIRYGPQILSKSGVLKRDGFKCAYCHERRADTVDHIIPRSKGGPDSWENLISSCLTCNQEKGNRTPEEAGMSLLFLPTVPQRAYISFKKK